MSYIDLVGYFLTTLQNYQTSNPNSDIVIERSINPTDSISQIQAASPQQMILIDAPQTPNIEEFSGGAYMLCTDTVRLQLWINVSSQSSNANNAYTLLTSLRQYVLNAMQTRKTQAGLLSVILRSAPQPTTMYNYVSDSMLFECVHQETAIIAV